MAHAVDALQFQRRVFGEQERPPHLGPHNGCPRSKGNVADDGDSYPAPPDGWEAAPQG